MGVELLKEQPLLPLPKAEELIVGMSHEQRDMLPIGVKVGLALFSSPELQEYAPDSSTYADREMECANLNRKEVVAENIFLTTESAKRPKYARLDKSNEGIRLVITEAGRKYLQNAIEKSKQDTN